MERQAKRIPCPRCGQAADPEGPWRPFCCERCKLADLNNWLSEQYRIPGHPAGETTDPEDEA